MMKSVRFTAQDVLDYRNNFWSVYASQSTDQGLIVFTFSAMGEYRVTLDGKDLYIGNL